jgi:phosphohistidine phosphatase
MKKVYLVRHAKSSWDDIELNDIDRPLNDRGNKDAPVMGKRLKEHGAHPDLMISSPAVRTLSTCNEIARALGYPEDKIKKDKRVYHADEEQLLIVLRELNSKVEQVMIFGHNPGLTEFANRLLDDTIDNIPTCGVVSCILDIQNWKEITWGRGEREFFDFPKDLPTYGLTEAVPQRIYSLKSLFFMNPCNFS